METNDRVFTIQLVGEFGAGKKTIVNKVLGRAGNTQRVVDNFVDLTQYVEPIPAPYNAVHLYIVDEQAYAAKPDRHFDFTFLVAARTFSRTTLFSNYSLIILLKLLLKNKTSLSILVTHSESAIRGINDSYASEVVYL